MVSHGPARCGTGHARVDEWAVDSYLKDGVNIIAVEVAGYYNAYSTINDHTAELNFLQLEFVINNDAVCATDDTWDTAKLPHRIWQTDRHSHCRIALELYHLDKDYFSWRNGIKGQLDWKKAQTTEQVKLLERSMGYPDFTPNHKSTLISYGSVRVNANKVVAPIFFDSWNPEIIENASERPSIECEKEDEFPLTFGRINLSNEGNSESPAIGYTPVNDDGNESGVYVKYDFKKLHTGFIDIVIELEENAVVDLIFTERLERDGKTSSRSTINTCARIHCKGGVTHFTTFEPYNMRYLKVVVRSKKRFTIKTVGIISYTCFDMQRGSFQCSDEDTNRLYEAARLTLQLNTLDIFMDCPDRERGGWLCDSFWTARAAKMMFGDTRVERAMLENFLCLPAEDNFHGFFPAVYPAKGSFKDGTILTWGMWLILELEEYYKRSGDRTLVDEFEKRIDAMLEGAKEISCSLGLIENTGTIFIDWSLSNNGEYTNPISVPGNSLYAASLDCAARMYGRADWSELADKIRNELKKVVVDRGLYDPRMVICDSVEKDGENALRHRNYYSESGQYTTLWAELFNREQEPMLIESIVKEYGPLPQKRPGKIDVAPSNIFIGLCVRLDMLAKLGEYETLYREIRYLFDEMITEGPGTFWETLSGVASRCHGFTAHVGVWLTRDILGLGIPEEMPVRSIKIAPHPCGLRFASGTVETLDGVVSLSWSSDERTFYLNSSIPNGYIVEFDIPEYIRGWNNIIVNGEKICAGTCSIKINSGYIDLLARP